jgi:hypothetical protein
MGSIVVKGKSLKDIKETIGLGGGIFDEIPPELKQKVLNLCNTVIQAWLNAKLAQASRDQPFSRPTPGAVDGTHLGGFVSPLGEALAGLGPLLAIYPPQLIAAEIFNVLHREDSEASQEASYRIGIHLISIGMKDGERGHLLLSQSLHDCGISSSMLRLLAKGLAKVEAEEAAGAGEADESDGKREE